MPGDMMRSLTLLRHAKSGWDDPVARDFDRPLNGRGTRAARKIGDFAREQDMAFDYLVASPAARVVETLEAFFKSYGAGPQAHWDRRIYLASAETLIDVVHDLPDAAHHVLMSGHNPGFEDLILTLVPDDGGSPLRNAVAEKLPTASLVTLQFSEDRWDKVQAGSAKLTGFTRPRDLDAALGPETY